MHVVPQVIKAEFVVCSVSNIATIGLFTVRIIHVVNNGPDRKTEKPIDRPHPLSIPFRKVVVDCYDMHAKAGESIQVDGERGDKGFSFTCCHFGNFPFMENYATNELCIEVPHADCPSRSFSGDGEGFRQKSVKIFSLFKPFFEMGCFCSETVVCKTFQGFFETADGFDKRSNTFDLPLVFCSDDFFYKITNHGCVRYNITCYRFGLAPKKLPVTRSVLFMINLLMLPQSVQDVKECLRRR